jgi:hypothetical protein
MKPLVILCLVFFAYSFRASLVVNAISIEKKKATSGNNYTIIYQNTCKMEFTDKRPLATDKSIKACIAGAFTQLDNYKVDGVYLCNGKITNSIAVNKTLGGALKIVNGQASIFSTQKGKLFTKPFLNALAVQKASMFQQIQLISSGVASKFKDKANFQRRAIVIFKNGKTAFVECAESILLATFSKDLVELGAKDALYTDMGGWDEGYYIDPKTSKKVVIGLSRTHTQYQSNWVVFRE